MKTTKLLILIFVAGSFITLASMRPENIPNNYHNFGINDTIDSLNNTDTNQVRRPRFESVVDDILEETRQELEQSRQKLEQEIKELEALTIKTQQQAETLERLRIKIQKKEAEIEKLNIEIKSLTNEER